MTDLEKAVRYLCLFETDDENAMIERYKIIEKIVKGDKELAERYTYKYEMIMELLCK